MGRIRHDSDGSNDQAQFWSGSEKEINHIFEYQTALDELMRCGVVLGGGRRSLRDDRLRDLGRAALSGPRYE